MNFENQNKIIVLAEPEPETRGLYHKHLASPNIVIQLCEDLEKLPGVLELYQPDLLIVNPGANPASGLVFLKNLRKFQPNLSIITIGYGTPDEYLDRFMELGVSCHINRYLTRPQDVTVAVTQVLGNIYQ